MEDESVAVSTNVLSLCSGGGGLDLGLRLAVPDARTVCYVENEVTACGVLANNMEKGWLDDAPIWTNLRTFDGTAWRGVVDCVIGGYPCQPFSLAGRRLGTADPRHLWPDVRRIVGEIQPRICFFENVGAHLRLGFDEVARDLQGMGYEVAAGLFTASEVGAPHGRERLFILAHRDQQHDDGSGLGGARRWAESANGSERVADANGTGLKRERGAGLLVTEPPCGRDADGRSAAQLAGAHDGREQEPGRRSQRGDAATGAGATGDELGYADGERRRVQGHGSEPPELAYQAERPFLWPPRPDDADGWRRVLSVRPDLAPAVEPPVRGVADGLAGWISRSDQLHILGNGVVPQQAELAYRTLNDAMSGARNAV